MYIGGNGFASLDGRCLYRQNRNNAKIQKKPKRTARTKKKGKHETCNKNLIEEKENVIAYYEGLPGGKG